MKSGHELVWEFSFDNVRATPVCHEPSTANCHLTCPEDCESYGEILRDPENGQPYHLTYNDGLFDGVRHNMESMSDCNIVLWLDGDPGMLPEMNSAREVFEIGRTPIEPVWEGDYYGWKKA